MKNTDEKIFGVQSALLRRALPIIQRRIDEIADEKPQATKKDAEIAAVVNLFHVYSLRRFQATVDFLADELLSSDSRRHKFGLPHLRSLTDIYARAVHLHIKITEPEHRAMTCISYQLQTYTVIKDSTPYRKTQEIYPELLGSSQIRFPANLSDFSRRWRQKNGVEFPSVNDLISKENFLTFSKKAVKLFGVEKSYEIYSHLSESLHGNPYQMHKPLNERFWIVALSLMTTAFLIELVDTYVLQDTGESDLDAWLKDVSELKPQFTRHWEERRAQQLKSED